MPKNPNIIDKIQESIQVQNWCKVPKHDVKERISQFPAYVPSSDNLGAGMPAVCTDINPDTRLSGSGECYNSIPFKSFLSVLNRLRGHVKLAFELQFIWSLRASEVLNIRHRDRLKTGLILVKGCKSSFNRLIYAPTILHLFCPLPSVADLPVFSIKYGAYYKALRKAGLCFKRDSRFSLNIVTHAPRKYNLAEMLANSEITIDELQHFSGHKSRAGLLYYLGDNSLFK